MSGIVERADVLYVCFYPPTEGDEGEGFRAGYRGVTEIRIVKRHGPLDFIPYVEVWKGDHLHAEAAQHAVSWVEFKP